jgi:hypothetical protein
MTRPTTPTKTCSRPKQRSESEAFGQTVAARQEPRVPVRTTGTVLHTGRAHPSSLALPPESPFVTGSLLTAAGSTFRRTLQMSLRPETADLALEPDQSMVVVRRSAPRRPRAAGRQRGRDPGRQVDDRGAGRRRRRGRPTAPTRDRWASATHCRRGRRHCRRISSLQALSLNATISNSSSTLTRCSNALRRRAGAEQPLSAPDPCG